jgi:2-polyprenyl-3-methyl-5-hydroxy-6-metoxy-1,4-benzoquinol methylase
MEYTGSRAYEENAFFDQFMKRRMRRESPNNLIEKPILLELIGDVTGKRILDLGCGEGMFGTELLDDGAAYYHGIDGSHNMLQKAKEHLAPYPHSRSSLACIDLNDWTENASQYDLVLSRMVFHYIEDLEPIFNKVSSTLKPNGSFIFSVMHPTITATFDHFTGKQKRSHWVVDDYFSTGKRVEQWMDHSVVKYHKTIEDYISLLLRSGFQLENLKEGKPREELFEDVSEFNRRNRIPLMLILSATRT